MLASRLSTHGHRSCFTSATRARASASLVSAQPVVSSMYMGSTAKPPAMLTHLPVNLPGASCGERSSLANGHNSSEPTCSGVATIVPAGLCLLSPPSLVTTAGAVTHLQPWKAAACLAALTSSWLSFTSCPQMACGFLIGASNIFSIAASPCQELPLNCMILDCRGLLFLGLA